MVGLRMTKICDVKLARGAVQRQIQGKTVHNFTGSMKPEIFRNKPNIRFQGEHGPSSSV